jgi:hypothetical protein
MFSHRSSKQDHDPDSNHYQNAEITCIPCVQSPKFPEPSNSGIPAMNASEAELAPVLKANFMRPVIQVTNNPLVVDTGRERILVDSGFGEKIGLPFGSFPRSLP